MKKRIDYRTLDSKVMVVAKEGAIGDWAAYIGAVPGINHDQEWPQVAAHGSKLPEDIACALFPSYETLVYRS